MDFDAFFRSEHDPLLRLCWAMVSNREQARDVAQEAMCRAYERWDRLGEPGSNPAGWVRTVALNLVRSQWRREQTRSAAAVPVVASYEDPPCTDPELVAALARLSNRQREAVVLHHLLDLDVAGCAAAMGIAASSVKAHLQRGRAALEVALGDRVLTTEGVA
ncbi:MAG: sigma-70 family RNA polymerase sigma factor [Microthrixaceae bacterium]|nr:sigma-70 family RNA polymerase sigma factor [Microthrixaceae bacterium]HMT62483.1 sigma-70 family RNA polymerase sigma factor [Microthrixaceae bacterium]